MAAALRLVKDEDPPASPPEAPERKRRPKKAKPITAYTVYCPMRGSWAHTEGLENGAMDRSIDVYPDFRGAGARMLQYCDESLDANRATIVEVVIDPANAVCIGDRQMPKVQR